MNRSSRHPMARLRARLGAFAAVLLCGAPVAMAHEGHDHEPSATPAPAGSAAPRRLPDGALQLPRPAQRLIGVRTVPVARADASRAIALPGRITIDPDAGGRVQPTVPGRLEAGPGGLPTLGQRVARGQVLATVRPTLDPVERATQAARVAELESARTLVQRRLVRLRELSDTVPRRDIEAAEAELESLDGRLRAVRTGIAAAEPLVAPVAGVISRVAVLAGQVVDARETVFEIVDPGRLQVEATGLEPALLPEVLDASIAVGGGAVPLVFVGASRVLRDQALPLVFRARHAALASLSVGLPLEVTVRLRGGEPGVPVPAEALARNAANEPIVWIKTAPERFEPRPVRTRPLDGARVLVVAGLAGGERVVTGGATLLGQYR
jgi:cobalt-zinc-cadmium efflux system membrane fusion protein